MNSETRRKWLLRLGKLVVIALLMWFIRASLVGAFEGLRTHPHWSVHWGWLALSGILYVLGMVSQAIFNRQLLVGVGQPLSMLEALRAYYVSQLGKYVPGKAMVLVLRAGALRRVGLSPTLVTASVFVETLTTMATGALVAIVCLVISPPPENFWMLVAAAVVMLLATGVPLVPPIFKFVVRMLHITGLNMTTVNQLAHNPRRMLVVGWLSISTSWFIYGLSLWALLVAIGAAGTDPLVNWPLHTAAVALSVVGGFLAMIPGGLIVREGFLVLLLAPVYEQENAVVAAIVWRLVCLTAELISSGLFYLVPTTGAPESAEPAKTE